MYKILDEKYTWKEALKLQDAEWVLPKCSDLQSVRSELPRFVNYWTLEESNDDKHFAIVYDSLYGRGYQIKPTKESVILVSNKELNVVTG